MLSDYQRDLLMDLDHISWKILTDLDVKMTYNKQNKSVNLIKKRILDFITRRHQIGMFDIEQILSTLD